jgi:thioredoxin 1
MSNWIKALGALLVMLFCIFFMARGFLPPADPQFVQIIDYDQLQRVEQEPCIVYFYHKSTDGSVRKMMPAFDELASHFKDKLKFCRYQLSDPEQKVPQKAGYESTFTVYDGGKEIRNCPVMQLSESLRDNEGMILVLIKNYLMAGNSDSAARAGAVYVTAGDFQQRVLDSSRPVIVDFTSAMCPPCRTLEPQFKQFASKDSPAADFYFVDHDNPANHSIVHQYSVSATPTVMLFVNGKPQGRFSGAFGSSDFNEGRILMLLQPYL